MEETWPCVNLLVISLIGFATDTKAIGIWFSPPARSDRMCPTLRRVRRYGRVYVKKSNKTKRKKKLTL